MFQEWLNRSVRYRQDVLGLSSEDILDYLWVIPIKPTDTTWDLSTVKRNRFNACFVIFDQGDALYYVTFKQLQGVIGRHLLQPIGTIQYLLFPWETSTTLFTPLKESCNYRITWLHDLAIPGGASQLADEVALPRIEARLRARTIAQLDPMDASTRGFCDLLFDLCSEQPQLAKKRAELEQLAFLDATARLSEKATLKWLRDNGMNLQQQWVAVTDRDLESFLQRFPNVEHPSELPRGCFEVPYEDAVTTQLPIYGPNGTCHLTYRDMPAWAWRHYERFKEVTRKICANSRDDIIRADPRMSYLMGAVVANERDIRKDKTLRLSSSSVNCVVAQTNAPVKDIEDLVKRQACPGCLLDKLAEREDKVHYKDAERTNLVSQLRNGKVPLNVVAEVFDGDRHTWDYEHYYKAPYAARPCAEFIENARNNAPSTIHCRYGDQENPQEVCAGKFQELHGSKWKPGSVLKYPFQWMLWVFLRK